MNFFTTSDNKAIENQTTFDMGGGDFEPMPNNTQLKAIIEEAKWDEYDDQKYISLKWVCIDGEFKARKVFQKIRVLDSDPKKSDKAKAMLAAIDSNAGGALMTAGVMPDDMSLSLNLMNKPMAIILAVWEIDDKKGNWVKAVATLNNPAPAQKAQESAATKPMTTDFDPDIGF